MAPPRSRRRALPLLVGATLALAAGALAAHRTNAPPAGGAWAYPPAGPGGPPGNARDRPEDRPGPPPAGPPGPPPGGGRAAPGWPSGDGPERLAPPRPAPVAPVARAAVTSLAVVGLGAVAGTVYLVAREQDRPRD